MNWMTRWPGSFPVFVERAAGASVVDVDGNAYVDLCLGDTGAMTGHAPQATVAALGQQAAAGITMMLPTDDATWAGEELTPALRPRPLADRDDRHRRQPLRHPHRPSGDGSPRVLVMNWCYHGTVDETLWVLDDGGASWLVPATSVRSRRPATRSPSSSSTTSTPLERELAQGDVALVLTEPALTNIGIVLPDEATTPSCGA